MLIGMDALQRAVKRFKTRKALAAALGVTPMAVSNWFARGVPAERCADIERVTDGAVRREDLRPDVFGAVDRRRMDECEAVAQ